MRLLEPSLLFLAPLLSSATRSATRDRVQVFLHPAPDIDNDVGAPTLSSSQASAVIGHHLGADLSHSPTPHDEGMWAHLMYLWDGPQRPRVVIVEGVEPQYVLPTTLDNPHFYIDTKDESVLDPFLDAAREGMKAAADLPAVKYLLSTLDVAFNSKWGQEVAQELSAITTLAEQMWSNAGQEWDAVAVRLGHAVRGTELWTTATKGLKAGLESMTQKDSPPIVLVIMPPAHQAHQHHAKRQILNPLAEACQSNATCVSNGCSGRGQCVETAKDSGCFQCACTSGYAGDTCQKTDYSGQFVLLVGTSVLLGLGVVMSVALLFSIGDESLPSTLNLAINSGHHL